MKFTALSLAAVLMAGTASAATTAFTLDISGDRNVPVFSLSNVGDQGDITGFTLSLGDLTRNFDSAHNATASTGSFGFALGPNLDTNTGGGLRANSVDFTFTDFNPGEIFGFEADIDRDNSNTLENYITSLLPGGSIVVNFAGGTTSSLFIDLTRPFSEAPLAAYSYTAALSVPPPIKPPLVPLPAGLPLLLAGLGALGIARRARR